MKKATTFVFSVFLFIVSSAQMEVGYNTADVGAEFQWYKDGKFIGVHLATNAKLHHSFHAMIGYYMAGDPTASFYYNLNNGGLGVGLGYRYYTNLRPHGFFIGTKADLLTHKVALKTQTLMVDGPYTSMIFIPSLQTGYMILINDMFFITPTASIGYKMNVQSEMSLDEKKAVGLFGISLGAKF
jgi:hypothetical protein